jgi:hypothetical protein
VPEWSKGVDSSSTVFALVGSNPTACKRRDSLCTRDHLAEWLRRCPAKALCYARESSNLSVVEHAHVRNKCRWFSGKIRRCHRRAPGSIPGRRRKAARRSMSHVVQVVRIVGFHPIDPGSSPGVGEVRVKEATIWPSG